MRSQDLHQRLADLGAKPLHCGRIVRAWLQGRALDACTARQPAEDFLPLGVSHGLPQVAAELEGIARLHSEHPASDGSSRLLVELADNGALVVNALDNLSGTDALISVRSRGRFSRPFVVVERLQREAETSFRQKEEQLKQRLADTEQQLAALQQGADPEKAVELTPEQQATVRQYMQEKLRIRKELREVQYQLNADIDALGRTLKLVNIALVPSLLTVGVLLGWLWRRRRMARGEH